MRRTAGVVAGVGDTTSALATICQQFLSFIATEKGRDVRVGVLLLKLVLCYTLLSDETATDSCCMGFWSKF